MRKISVALLSIALLAPWTGYGDYGPVLQIKPDVSMILLEGTELSGTKHVLHTDPCFGIGVDLAFAHLLGGWTPQFEFSSRKIQFSGANGETLSYGTQYYNQFAAGIGTEIVQGWMASGLFGYSDQLFLRSAGANALWIDRVSTPEAKLKTSVGLYQYRSILFQGSATAFAYFPVSTSDYSAKLGYGIRPSLSTTHVFSNHLSGAVEAYYLRRMQNSSVFDLTEHDFGVALSLDFHF